MAILDNLKTSATVEQESDSVGGAFLLDSGAYDMVVDLAYLSKSAGGALSLNLHLKGEGNSLIRNTLWITSGDAKGNKNTYKDREGKDQYLPGFNQANSLALLTVGKEIGDLETETKVVNLYDFDKKKELPTKVEVYTDLLNQDITVGLIKQIVDRNVKDDAGNYVPSGQTREENEIGKLFRFSDKMTTAEIRSEAPDATFLEKWKEKWTGNTRDRSSGTAASTGTTAGAPPTKKLFTK